MSDYLFIYLFISLLILFNSLELDRVAGSTFPLNVGLEFCYFGAQWSIGPQYTLTMAPGGIFGPMEQWMGKGGGITQHGRICTIRTAALTPGALTNRRQSLVGSVSYNFRFWAIFLPNRIGSHLPVTHILMKFCPLLLYWAKYTARCHGISWSVAPLSAKIDSNPTPQLNEKCRSAATVL